MEQGRASRAEQARTVRAAAGETREDVEHVQAGPRRAVRRTMADEAVARILPLLPAHCVSTHEGQRKNDPNGYATLMS